MDDRIKNVGLGSVVRFRGSADLYKIVYEIDGIFFARWCWDDYRYSIEPGRLSRQVVIEDIEEVICKVNLDLE
jgi:hypothetical protein